MVGLDDDRPPLDLGRTARLARTLRLDRRRGARILVQPRRPRELGLVQRRRPRLSADDLVLPSGQLADALGGQLQALVDSDLHDAAAHPDFLQAWRLIPAAAEHRGFGFDRIAESEWIG